LTSPHAHGIIRSSQLTDFIVNFLTDNVKLSTREVILRAIKQANEATVDQLASAADVSPVTVRHHLHSLQADGLLDVRSVRRKVGRPYYVYTLSEQGNELFPQRYVHLSSRLLDELKARFPDEVVAELLHDVVAGIVDEHRERFEALDFEDRLDYLVQLLAQEGFLASWEISDNGYRLTEYSCPYFSIGQKHVEVCVLDRQIIQSVMETEVKQQSCVLNGDDCCQFNVLAPAELN
jgi:DeoR family suf operon transcriptional repressor